ncbi:GNAT family N-acetyltransferase [Faunimonas pinastri]|uniref:GNAT family N-acetyltransferase n=1 Tax=Faunimonas pinastri TaxID=1855383 RepID=UPI000B82037A|nr:GNAT family N-acetyltransferase [Faunimonas pinastri]
MSNVSHRSTARLRLRPPNRSDLDFIIDLFSRPELVVHRPDPTPDTSEASRARLMRDVDHWDVHGFGRWAVESDGRLIGFGGLTFPKIDLPGLNVSYHLDPSAWGRGYASELIREVALVGFEDLDADRLIGLVRAANPASRRVLEKAGFRTEGEVVLYGAPTELMTLRRSPTKLSA